MNHPQLITWIALALAAASTLGCAALCCFLVRARRAAADILALAVQLDAEVTDLSRDRDTNSRRASDQSRRIAWLETRARSARSNANPKSDVAKGLALSASGTEATGAPRASMTERRYRVLTLKRRGLSADAIAAQLGMTHGEVGLIISLSNAL
ncbi:MAG: hypothetical protein ACRD9R_14350 [Pyrinomonadaceae bacterium]